MKSLFTANNFLWENHKVPKLKQFSGYKKQNQDGGRCKVSGFKMCRIERVPTTNNLTRLDNPMNKL